MVDDFIQNGLSQANATSSTAEDNNIIDMNQKKLVGFLYPGRVHKRHIYCIQLFDKPVVRYVV
jgi:hypothetical protein